MPYEFLEHTADTQVECRAPSFTALLETAARAMYAVALNEVREAKELQRAVSVEGASREEVVVRFLQELLFLLDTDHFVATTFSWETNNAAPLKYTARLEGYRCAPGERTAEIKSTTYHDLEVRETPQGLVARVIFDI